jgi:hypothetical protein
MCLNSAERNFISELKTCVEMFLLQVFYFLFFPTIPRVVEEAAFVLALG